METPRHSLYSALLVLTSDWRRQFVFNVREDGVRTGMRKSMRRSTHDPGDLNGYRP